MNWKEAIDSFNVPKMYQDVCLSQADMLSDSLKTIGKNWVASYPRRSLFLSGTPGCGKTYFSYCLFREIIESGKHWQIFVKSDQLDSELLKASLDGTEYSVLRKYLEVEVLFLDDLGVERGNERILKQYYTLIDGRTSNNMTTVITSNLPLARISDTLGDRIASRLELCYEIKFPNQDLRKKVLLEAI